MASAIYSAEAYSVASVAVDQVSRLECSLLLCFIPIIVLSIIFATFVEYFASPAQLSVLEMGVIPLHSSRCTLTSSDSKMCSNSKQFPGRHTYSGVFIVSYVLHVNWRRYGSFRSSLHISRWCGRKALSHYSSLLSSALYSVLTFQPF